jgi:hypothetical protein
MPRMTPVEATMPSTCQIQKITHATPEFSADTEEAVVFDRTTPRRLWPLL